MHPYFGRHHFMDRAFGFKMGAGDGGKVSRAPAFISQLPRCGYNVTSCLPPLLPCLPWRERLDPQRVNQRKPFFQLQRSGVYLVIVTRKVSTALTKSRNSRAQGSSSGFDSCCLFCFRCSCHSTRCRKLTSRSGQVWPLAETPGVSPILRGPLTAQLVFCFRYDRSSLLQGCSTCVPKSPGESADVSLG